MKRPLILATRRAADEYVARAGSPKGWKVVPFTCKNGREAWQVVRKYVPKEER